MLKLSDAILLGAMDGRQLFGKLCDEDGNTCAMGSALKAAGLLGKWSKAAANTLITDAFPILTAKVKDCECGLMHPDLWDRIVHLNNGHRLTRQEIAAYVETIEPPEQPQPETVVERSVEEAVADR